MYGYDDGKPRDPQQATLIMVESLTFKASDPHIIKAHWECPKCLTWFDAEGTNPKAAYYCPFCPPQYGGIRPIAQLVSEKPKAVLTTDVQSGDGERQADGQ